MELFAFYQLKRADRSVNTLKTLGEYISAELQRRDMSNRALAAGAGVSESVIRNLLQHGRDPRAKDPDPRTLRAVADYLNLDALKLFRLAGYIPPPGNGISVRAEYVAEVFDRLPEDKQDAVMSVIEAFADRLVDKETMSRERPKINHPLEGLDLYSPRLMREAANELILAAGVIRAMELDGPRAIKPDLELWNPRTPWTKLPPSTQRRILALAKAKLNLEYDPTMVDPEWRT